MLLKRLKITTTIFLVICCVIQFNTAASYKTEVAITPAPPEEETTAKSGGFFGWFRRDKTTTTTTPLPVLEATTAKIPQTLPGPNNAALPGQTSGGAAAANRPPPLTINPAPLVPLGPRPDTPSTSPWGGNPKQPPQWPQSNPQNAQDKPEFPGSANGASGGGTYVPGGAHMPGSPILPAATSTTTVKPTQPQSPYNVVNNVPKPSGPTQSGGAFNFPAAPTAQSNQNNLPTPGQSPNLPTSQSTTSQNNLPRPNVGGQPNVMPGFGPYQPPKKSQPSGFDLSYGGGGGGVRPVQPSARPGFGPAPGVPNTSGFATSTTTSTTTSTSTTTTTTAKPNQMGFDPKKPASPTKEDFPALPGPRRPSIGGGVKEDFPALPVPKSPTPTPSSPHSPSSPSAWNKPLPTPVAAATSTTTPKTPTPKLPAAPGSPGGNGVSFVPHSGGRTTTVRPGFQSSTDNNPTASDAEIQSLTETLYNKETNSQLSLLTVNPQGKTRSIDSTDEAPQPLLEVNPKVYENPIVAKMRLLFNNYEQDTLTNEHVTPNERKEENDFVDAVMATSVMRQAMLFLQNKGIVGPDPKAHRDLVKELWFTQYSRGSGRIGSSGFEHVFVNEVKNGTIIGLHNWVYFADEEKAGHLDYKGYLNQVDLGNKAKVLKVRFTHNGLNKPVNTLFVGTSPELELALYTVCFKLRPDRTCPVSLGNSKFGIVTYSWRYRGKSLIGSAYPEI
uniref:Endoribonuclease XendoU n=1 Tax=Musca domestica TaxID=7370 RepID=T1PE22_MUSDO